MRQEGRNYCTTTTHRPKALVNTSVHGCAVPIDCRASRVQTLMWCKHARTGKAVHASVSAPSPSTSVRMGGACKMGGGRHCLYTSFLHDQMHCPCANAPLALLLSTTCMLAFPHSEVLGAPCCWAQAPCKLTAAATKSPERTAEVCSIPLHCALWARGCHTHTANS